MTSFARKKQLISYLFILWGQSKYVSESSENIYDLQTCNDLDRHMRYALSQLSDEQKKIIRKEFMEKTSPNWYLEYYSRSSFYRHKKQCMDTFIRCLHGRKMVK
ncbi:MAG: hypothetical protein CVU85_05230 [Firmicutes bacterium HGW-Firmicutes-10]|jgi:hypothetical protein|nr:MAG: hypothetical protein CVU85_05230 [Firmicutes bacterium HGW-Firmicutes-10]